MTLEHAFTPALGRDVFLRPGTSDRQVWTDTFTGLYHVPPASMPAPRTVLDLGANIGLTAAHYRALWPGADVLAVEMDLGSANLIRGNAPGVRLAMCAVSDCAGIGYYEGAAASDSYALGGDPSSPRAVSVPRRTLREIILRGFAVWTPSARRTTPDEVEPGAGVDFVKMDVEGEEWRILERGDWAPLVRHLLVELHGPGAANDLLVAAMSKLAHLGFEVRRHLPHPHAVYAHR